MIVGRVVDAHGVRGDLKVRPFTESLYSLLDFPRWNLTRRNAVRGWYKVDSSKPHGKFIVSKLCGVDTRDQALELKGSDVLVDTKDFPELPKGEYYHFQLLGLEVIDVDESVYGQVDRVMQTGANDVLVVEGEATCLIPYIPDVIKNVDLDAGVIRVDWYTDF